jgi:hypothetical protein
VTDEPATEDRAFRCSVSAVDEPMAGSAAVAAAYLLVEHPGPWGRKALAESRFPEHVRHGLAEAADAAGVRVQLIRRPGRSAAGDGLRIFATYADPVAPRTLTAHVNSPEALLVLDLAAVAAGEDAGLVPHDQPLYLVCTNGRRDLCCAELGRPIVAALAAAYPDETWETTHVGGHRFAGAMVVLPHGLSYGRLDADSALRVVEKSRAGELDLAHLRGRSAYDGAVQAAEIAARERLGETRIDALTLLGSAPDPVAANSAAPTASALAAEGAEVTEVRFGHARGEVTVRVVRVPSPPARQSCADLIAKPGTRYLAT